jgi:hypothetical protein
VDECLPEDLVEWLPDWDVSMVQHMRWAGVKNGELLRRAEGKFDLFLTADKNLRYQQNLKGRRLAILLLPAKRTSTPRYRNPRSDVSQTHLRPDRSQRGFQIRKLRSASEWAEPAERRS